ncbi:sensor histidine kinase [Fusibacter sp. JL216-2]|uniref:sensor histidine kinase n=1 Tax=Fusibacter sp. JL216-2 TaxID=3071453 RepID=UPI003D3396D4
MIHKIKNASQQTKIMGLLMIMSTLMTITLGIVFYQNTIEDTLTNKEKEILTLASLTSNKIERFLFERSADAEVLSKSQIFTLPDISNQTRLRYLSNVISAYKAYDAVLTYNNDGAPILKSGQLSPALRLDLNQLLPDLLGHESYTSDIRKIDNKKYIYFSKSLTNSFGDVTGHIVEVMNFNAINDILNDIRIGQTGSATLKLYDPQDESNQLSGVQITDRSGQEVIIATHPLIKYPSQTDQWYIEISQNIDEALLVKKEITKHFFYVIMVVLALFYSLSAIISHHVTLPIRLLMEKTNALIDNNQKFASDVVISDEVKNLANSFDLLLEELHFMMQRVLEKSGEAAHIDLIRGSIDKLIEGLPSGIITVDHNGLVSSINPPALEFLKVNKEDLLGQSISQQTSTHLRPLLVSISNMFKTQKTLHDAVCSIQLPGGQESKINYSVLIQYDSHDHFIGLTVLLNPLDAKRNFEESIIRAKKLSQLGELAAGVAHEVRNPLSSIRGYAQLVLREVDDNTQVRSDINVILQEADRLDTMIDRFLSFARPNTPKLGRFHMNDIIEDTIKLIRKDQSTKNIQIRHRFTKQDLVLVDYEQMKQVFINLILNAVQAMPEGGHIDIVTLYSEVSGTMDIHIVDTGEGIDPEQVSKIFTPFFTTRDKGSGLGLSICSRIIENHNGVMDIKSSHEGTQIIIKIPVENYKH